MSNLQITQSILNILRTLTREGIDKLIDYLLSSDFFVAPASTKYHANYPGGLAEHSYNVYTCLSEKVKLYKLDIPAETTIIVSLLHDICKTDFYKIEKKNVLKGKIKNGYGKEVNNWVEEDVYVCQDKFPMGHGEKSVIILMKYINLTDLEIAMIRWHMGFTEPKDSWINLNGALKLYPEIMALHTSDLEASYLMEGRGENGQTAMA